MSQNSKIEWTDATWNPVTGCTRVSAGCDNCYAVKQTHRMDKMGQSKKYGGLTVLNPRGDRHFNGVVKCHEDALQIPIRRKTPTTYFVNSMSDLFHKDVPDHFIDRVFRIIHDCPQHIFQILTKRPERMAEYTSSYRMAKGFVPEVRWPLRNAWLGTSLEDQQTADERIPYLLKCPATVRFLSIEPLLGEIDLQRDIGGTLWIGGQRGCGVTHHGVGTKECPRELHHHHDHRCNPGIDWVIVGGESGPRARPMHPDWAKSIRDQCVAAGVPFFFKQWGEWLPYEMDAQPPFWSSAADGQTIDGHIFPDRISDGDPVNGWLADMDPKAEPVVWHRVGKKSAGRLLDGREWNEMPSIVGH